jgi:hypothetical protein
VDEKWVDGKKYGMVKKKESDERFFLVELTQFNFTPRLIMCLETRCD